MEHKPRYMARCVLCICQICSITTHLQPIPGELNPTDTALMRRASHWEQKARSRGNRPFDAVEVSGSGDVMTSNIFFVYQTVRDARWRNLLVRTWQGGVLRRCYTAAGVQEQCCRAKGWRISCRDVFDISAQSI